ncbi:mechanosensitive ion channel family protein [Jannaschia sp. Os4]|uniref:mechanosensitive ion channel family protein n=1 Tax=Jannaschia sp. Os4 TaxID=2807617 RepID=UPI00193A838C|nr:mechanosensitive ion channel family protein [Jannaschia sp. Os4]MBM2576376.1 mechanosensitive ion channel family protein [Jannaschia sp. Os4]
MQLRRVQAALDVAGHLTATSELSMAASGRLDDGLAPNLERIGSLAAPDGEDVPMLAARGLTPEGGETEVWRISDESIAAMLALDTRDLIDSSLGDWIADFPEGPTLFGAPTRDWLVLLGYAAFAYGAAWLLVAFRGIVGRYTTGGDGRLGRFVALSSAPLRLLLAVLIFTAGARFLGVSVVARAQLDWLAGLALWLSVAWILWRAVDAGAGALLDGMSRRGQVTAFSAVTFFSRVVKALLVAIFAAIALRALGIDITAGLAALGVGGLALALGAQKLMENLIGSVTLIADRPVRVGEFCRFGPTLGTVEAIGIRSTRIRTLGRTVVTVPNGEFSNLHLEDFTHRDQFLFHHTINLTYDTDGRTLRMVLSALRTILHDDPDVLPDPARVRLTALGAHSKDVELFAYVQAEDWNAYLAIQEELFLRIVDAVEGAGAEFAFPTQNLHLDGRLRTADDRPVEEAA